MPFLRIKSEFRISGITISTWTPHIFLQHMTLSQPNSTSKEEYQLPPINSAASIKPPVTSKPQIAVKSITIPVEYYDMSCGTPPNTPSESCSFEMLEKKLELLNKTKEA